MKKQIRLNAFAMNCVAHQSPGLWTHPRDRTLDYNRLPYWIDLAKTLADLAVAIELSDFSVVTHNPRVQFGQSFPQLSHQRANHGIESAVLIVAEPRQSSPQIADVLCDDNAMLPEKTADLIDQPDAISNPASANPMNRLHR